MLLWKGSFQLLLLFVCVLVGAAYATEEQGDQESSYQNALTAVRALLRREGKTDESAADSSVQTKENVNVQKRRGRRIRITINIRISWRRRRRLITEEADDNDSKVEDDNFIIDTDNNIMMDVMTGEEGDEVTITDYNKGVLAVLTPGDKMCRLHELAAEDRNVDLKTEVEELEKISEEKKVMDTSLDKIVEYKVSNKPVKEEDLGEKISQLCNRKAYKMVWMEAVTESDTDQDSDGTDESERMLDTVLDGIEKRGKCAFGWKWDCEWLCVKTRYDKCPFKRPRCNQREKCKKRAWWT